MTDIFRQESADTKAAHRARARWLLDSIDWRANQAPSEATMALCAAQAATAHALLATTAPDKLTPDGHLIQPVTTPTGASCCRSCGGPIYRGELSRAWIHGHDPAPNEYRPDC